MILRMKKLLATFLFITGLSTQVYAHDLMMMCDVRPYALSHFKYDDRLLMKDKAYARVEGKWSNLCESLTKALKYKPNKIRLKSSYGDNAVTCNLEHIPTGNKYKYIFDFETKTFTMLYHEVAIDMPGRVVEEELSALEKFNKKYGIEPNKPKGNNIDFSKRKTSKKKEYDIWGFPIEDQADEDDVYRLSFKRKCE